MSAVLTWVKNNVYVVIFVAIMLAAAISMPMVAGKLNSKVQSKVGDRVKLRSDLQRLTRTDFTPPGSTESTRVLVNERFLAELREVVEQQREDAGAVYEAAVEHNSRGRGVLVPALLPKPALAEAQVLQIHFFEVLRDGFEDLLAEINAGAPPDPAEVQRVLQRKEASLLTQMFFTDSVETLTEEQRDTLRDRLIETRTASYAQAAEGISLYATLDRLVLPPTDGSYLPSLGEIYDWQWTYWIVEDIALGLARANAEAPSVIRAPVKRILSVDVVDQGALAGSGSAEVDGRRGGAPPSTPLNPKAAVAMDFSASLTGRNANALYDVRYVNLSLIIDANQLPLILDAVAAQNFITVVNLDLTPADAFEAARNGYFYGSGQISRLDVKLETIWLRQWMIPFMPDDVRATLGIVVPEKPAAG